MNSEENDAYSEHEYVDLKTLAERLHLDRKTVKTCLEAGGVYPVALSNRSLRYLRVDVDSYLKMRHTAPKNHTEDC